MSPRDLALCILVIILWAGNIVAIRVGVTEMPPLIFLALRFVFTALVFLPFMKWPGWKPFWIIFQISVLMSVIHQGLLFVGMHYVNASTTVILLQTQVIFSVIMGWLFLKEKIGWRTISGIALGISGIVVIFGAPVTDAPVFAYIMLISSSVFVVLAYMRMKVLENIHPATYIALLNVIAMPFLLVGTLITDFSGWMDLGNQDWTLAGPVLAYQVFIVSMTHIAWQRILARNDMSKAMPLTLLNPVFCVAFSALLLGEKITWMMVLGGVMTLAGVAIITFRRIQKGIEPQPEVTD